MSRKKIKSLLVACGVAAAALGESQSRGQSSTDTLLQASPLPVSSQPAVVPRQSPVEEAERLWAQGDHAGALTSLRQLVFQPDGVVAATAGLRLGEYLLEMHQAADAEQELRRAIQRISGGSDRGDVVAKATLALIEAIDKQDRLAEATGLARELFGGSADRPAVQGPAGVKLGRLLKKQGNLDEAERILISLDQIQWPADAGGQKAWGTLTRGELLSMRNEHHAALSLYERAISEATGEAKDKDEPRNWARVRLMEAFTYVHKLDRAAELAEAVQQEHAAGKALADQAAWALIWKSEVLSRRGAMDEAIDVLRQAAGLLGTAWPEAKLWVEFYWAGLERKNRNSAEAIRHYQAAMEQALLAKIDGSFLDTIRQEIATEMQGSGNTNGAVAWLRMGIEDPAKMSDSDFGLSDSIVAQLGPEEAESWCKYLLNPAASPDPTQAVVQAEFGAPPPPPSSTVLHERCERWLQLGRLYKQRQQIAKAREAADQALAAATTNRESGRALADVIAYRPRGWDRATLLQMAQRASEYWVNAIPQAQSDGDAHYCIEMAFAVYGNNGLGGKVIETLERLDREITTAQRPSLSCFIRYNLGLAHTYAGRDEKAREIYESILAEHLDRPFGQGYEQLCSRTIIQLAHLYAAKGDLASAYTMLDKLEEKWPDNYISKRHWYRASVEAAAKLAARKGN